ncbi:uncharacterized protein LOC113324511 [Papaver somniferum]|uniref:uncharacterized protein LOC113324511 n=1 Tax=Papaver somniferum TaxID=3469 RepID=UPI000E702773|nr:uncharacterized protein LOC113324511 [Papaver somniferum]
MVQDSWNAPLEGNPTYVFAQKLKRLKAYMKVWNQQVFGNVYVRLKQAQLRLQNALRIADENPFDLHKNNVMKEVSVEVNNIRMQLATMLKQKSKNQWLVEGASNTSFFHNNIRILRSSNAISELVDDHGVTISDCDHIRDLAVNYFINKFNGDVSVPVDSLFDVEHESITIEESGHTDQTPSFEEIYEAVFSLGADSAPGPYGVLGNLVSEEQVAFMKGRNIHENISLASEMVNEIQIKRKDGNVGLKLDITQALDTISWSFILEVFRSIDRGIRQGDPLSPLIFVLIEDVLSRNITKLFREGARPTIVSRKGISPTHLFFADDIMIYCKGNMKSLRNHVALLGYYQRASGQTVSRAKSKIYYGGGSLRRRATISDFLGMPIATFTVFEG